ncbi:MAG: Ldh family oxidoreductase [Pseudomonadota bacterium]|nr:Ldh family oxidoreductase [Pseudomonadota bacterium]
MENISRSVSELALSGFVRKLFSAAGVPKEDAVLIAKVLVWSNLRGVDSHGVLRIPGYLARIDSGISNPKPSIRKITDLPAATVLEADRALGQVALAKATAIAIDKAKEAGLGLCLIRHATHMGAIGYFTLEIAGEGMAGIAVNTSRPNMAYPGARTAGLATSPIAISVPGASHAPLMLDMATATQSMGKIQLARDTGSMLGEGWAIDANGRPTTDPNAATIPTALGGHKGGGLALMFECITSLIVANPLIAPFLEDAPEGGRHMQNGLVIAIDISQFSDIGKYIHEVDRLTEAIKSLPRAENDQEILVPGERGDLVLERRRAGGIPVPEGTWKRLEEVASKLGVEMPETTNRDADC